MWPPTASIGSTSPRKRSADARVEHRHARCAARRRRRHRRSARAWADRVGRPRRHGRRPGRERAAAALPGLQAAIEDGDFGVAEPAQHPPQARRVDAAVRIDADHLRARRDAEAADGAREVGARGQRVAAVAAGLGGAQVAVEVQVVRARDVRLAVAPLAARGVGKVEAGVDDDRRAAAGAQRGQLGRADEGRERSDS